MIGAIYVNSVGLKEDFVLSASFSGGVVVPVNYSFDGDFLSVVSVVNGSGSVIDSSNYTVYDGNFSLLDNSSVYVGDSVVFKYLAVNDSKLSGASNVMVGVLLLLCCLFIGIYGLKSLGGGLR